MCNIINPTAKMMSTVVVGNNVRIGANVYIDYGTIIYDNVTIGDNSYVGANCILGERLSDFYKQRINLPHPLVVGSNAIIRSGTIIYGESSIGDNFQTGHRATIRERSVIGNNVRIGTLADIQGSCSIDDYVSIHSGVFVAPNATISQFAWLFPHVVLTNDPTPPSSCVAGVRIGEYAIIAAGALLLPGVNIGKNTLVAAGSVVTRDVADGKVVLGAPAKVKCNIEEIKNRTTGDSVYPWQYHYSHGMPWHEIGYQCWLNNERTQI